LSRPFTGELFFQEQFDSANPAAAGADVGKQQLILPEAVSGIGEGELGEEGRYGVVFIALVVAFESYASGVVQDPGEAGEEMIGAHGEKLTVLGEGAGDKEDGLLMVSAPSGPPGELVGEAVAEAGAGAPASGAEIAVVVIAATPGEAEAFAEVLRGLNIAAGLNDIELIADVEGQNPFAIGELTFDAEGLGRIQIDAKELDRAASLQLIEQRKVDIQVVFEGGLSFSSAVGKAGLVVEADVALSFPDGGLGMGDPEQADAAGTKEALPV